MSALAPSPDIPDRMGRGWLQALVVAALALFALSRGAVPARADLDDDYNLALQFYKQDRWDLAADKLQQFLKQAPQDHAKVPLAQLYLGQALTHQRKFSEARPVFREFVEDFPGHDDVPLAMYRVAECSYFLNDLPAARKELKAFLAKVPADHVLAEWALDYLGETELQLGHHDAALQVFEQGLKQFEKGRLAEEMRFGLARASEAAGRHDAARQLYERIAAAAGSRAADAQFNLAARLFEDQQYQAAAERFAAIAAKFPAHSIGPLATLNAGYSRYHLGEYPQAIEQFQQVQEDARLGATATYWIGLSLKSQEKYDEAATVLLDQYAKDDQQPLAESLLFHAADSRLGAEDYAEAGRLFQEVHRRWPGGEMADDALHLATQAAILAGNFQAARNAHQQFAAEFPQSGLKLPQDVLWGRLLLAEGDQLAREADGKSEPASQRYRDAAAAFTRVIEKSTIEETQSLARLQLARAWDRLSNYEQVLKTLKPLLDERGQNNLSDSALTALAMQSTALLLLERHDKAIAAAKEYLSRKPNGPEAADVLANLSLASARKQDWPAASDALSRLRATGNHDLADRTAFEVAETAYDASQWEIAEHAYQSVVDRGPGPDRTFYRPSISGLAYSLHEQGRALDQQAAEAKSGGNSGTSLLAQAIRKFDAAARWFSQLAELSAQQNDRGVQSDAQYMRGLSLRLARRLPAAADVFLEAAGQFGLPADVEHPSETELKAGYNAYRSAKEAARAFQELGQIEAADAAYQTAAEQLQRQPADRQDGLDALLNEWALLHYNAGAFDRAGELFARLVEENPHSPWTDDARMLLAENDYFHERYAPAREAFQSLVADETTDDFVRERSLVLLMDIAARSEDWKELSSAAKSLADRFPEGDHRWEAEYRRGEAALRRGELETAATIFRELAAQRDNASIAAQQWYPGVWLMLAETYLRLKQYDQVAQTAGEFAEQHPDSPLQYHLDEVQGRALQKQARFDEARAAFQKVIDSPHGKGTQTAANSQLFIAETYFVERRYEQAFEEYSRVLLYGFPELQAAALFQAGKSEELLKRWQGAAKSYRQLLEQHPDSEYATKARSRLHDLQQRFPETVGS